MAAGRAPGQPMLFPKLTVALSWSMAVKPEPFTLAVLFWLEAPAPLATCCPLVALP